MEFSNVKRMVCVAACILNSTSAKACEVFWSGSLTPSALQKGLSEGVQSRFHRLFDQACAVGLGQEGDVVCQVQFTLKDPAALTLFDETQEVMSFCLSERAKKETDPGVNHPDSYKAVSYEWPKRRIRLVYKDKSTLDATFVTVRVFNLP